MTDAADSSHMLSDCIKESLEINGKLGKIKAEIKKSIFDTINGEIPDPPPLLTSENFIINELICEYLKFNGYDNALSVFVDESGQPRGHLNRTTLANELNVQESPSTQKLPLLYSLVQYFTATPRKM